MRNVLLLGERRGVLAARAIDGILAKLSLIVEIDKGDAAAEADRALAIARGAGLKLYDAIYLEKALREGRSLASRDGRLLDAATSCGVDVFDARG